MGLTPAQLAELVGTSQKTIRSIEQQRDPAVRYRPDFQIMQNCAVVLGCSLDDLVDEDWFWTQLRADGPAEPPAFEEIEAARRNKNSRTRP
jgi:DNA-binding XRE family transcriptional regulator